MKAMTLAAIAALLATSTAHAAENTQKLEPREMLTFAMMMLQSNRFDVAEKVARDGIADHPTQPGFHLVLAEALRGEKKTVDAFYEYQLEIVQEGPAAPTADAAARRGAELLQGTSVEAHEMVRVLQAVKQMESNPQAAEKELAAIEARSGKRIALEIYRAEALQEAGSLTEAASTWEEILAQQPSFVPALVELAQVREGQHDHQAAELLLAKAKKLDARNWRLQEASR